MAGAGNSGLFVNDGSFLERFKQLQQEQTTADVAKGGEISGSVPVAETSESPKSALTVKKATFLPAGFKPSAQKPVPLASGKLAFSLKQKSRLPLNPLKLAEDDEEDGDDGRSATDRQVKKQKLERPSELSLEQPPEPKETTPSPPTDPEVKKVADKLASFVAKNGRQFENVTRQKNPGDTPFRFLFDTDCPEYKYYEFRVAMEEQTLAQAKITQNTEAVGSSASSRSTNHHSRPAPQQSSTYQTPASALYAGSNGQRGPQQSIRSAEHVQAEPSFATDPVAMMEFYMKKAAQEDLRKPPKYSKDEMPPPASLQSQPSSKKGHHMGDYIPQEELEKFLAKCNDAVAQKVARESAERAKIQSDNVGHRLLSKMGWREGEGLGSGKGGRADPVQAGAVKLNNLGVGAEQPGEVTAEDDIYDQYKKRMMLGYRFRPNPLNNPRKAYY